MPDASAMNHNTSTTSSTTNFRNVSACNRCRNRKNRCDQKLPRCTGCEKANVKCVGFDPVSKRQIPRSYVYYLETRVNSLEAILRANNVPCPPPSDDFSISETIKPGINVPFPPTEDDVKHPRRHTSGSVEGDDEDQTTLDPALQDNIFAGSTQSDTVQVKKNLERAARNSHEARSHPAANAIPFSRVVFAAVKSSVPHSGSDRRTSLGSSSQGQQTATGGAGGSSSFFALHTKPAAEPAPFPEKSIGRRLVDLYFEFANPQLPILHRPEFTTLFERVYATEPDHRTPRELYLLNMVFAIGSGIIMDSSNDQSLSTVDLPMDSSDAPNRKRIRITGQQRQPEEYHASAIVHLDSFLGTSPAAVGVGGGLEELQAVLLLAGLALLRPFAPGLWYIIGVAVRLAIDLGLHCEENDQELDRQAFGRPETRSRSKGRRQWARDLRRRLWWSTFSLDRLVSTCVGRPIGIIEQVVTTAFPSLLDDKHITPQGFLKPPNEVEGPTYKFIARHYFRLRLLQSEILQVLQYRQAEQIRLEQATLDGGYTKLDPYLRVDLLSPFLHGFNSFRDWRLDVDRRLWEWKESAPKQSDTGVAFTPLFLELNYWQAVIMLYRQSLAVPEPLADEMSPATGDMASPNTAEPEAKEDEQMVFMKVAQAGQTVLKIYRQLHRLKLVNYTFLATHHLFMSGKMLSLLAKISKSFITDANSKGISFLYAIWHSELVRSQVTLDDVDFTVLIATSVLSDMIEKCPPAEACRDAFVRMSKATISMCMSTTGFGNKSTLGSQPLNSPGGYFTGAPFQQQDHIHQRVTSRGMPMPQFDMNLKDLFSDEEIANRPFNLGFNRKNQTLGPTMVSPNFGARSMISNRPAPSSINVEAMQRIEAASVSPPVTYHVPARQRTTSSNTQLVDGMARNTTQPDDFPAFEDFDGLYTQSDTVDQGFWSQISNLNNQNDFDFGFGTGGFDGAWDSSGGVDLFDGLFFGNTAATSGPTGTEQEQPQGQSR